MKIFEFFSSPLTTSNRLTCATGFLQRRTISKITPFTSEMQPNWTTVPFHTAGVLARFYDSHADAVASGFFGASNKKKTYWENNNSACFSIMPPLQAWCRKHTATPQYIISIIHLWRLLIHKASSCSVLWYNKSINFLWISNVTNWSNLPST